VFTRKMFGRDECKEIRENRGKAKKRSRREQRDEETERGKESGRDAPTRGKKQLRYNDLAPS